MVCGDGVGVSGDGAPFFDLAEVAAGAVADAARWGTSAYVDLSSSGALEYGRGRRVGGGVVAQCDDFALFVGADGLFAVTGDVVVAVDARVGGVRGGVRGGVWVDVPGDRTLSGPTLVAVEGLDLPPPRSAAGGVFEDDACFQELRANGVGAGEVARFAGGGPFRDERFDGFRGEWLGQGARSRGSARSTRSAGAVSTRGARVRGWRGGRVGVRRDVGTGFALARCRCVGRGDSRLGWEALAPGW